MPELRVKATELVDANVDFVSLVKRGANRIPFRIVKQEDEPMLNLHKIGLTLFNKADTAPEIVAAVVPAGTDMTLVAEVFKGAGLDTKVFIKTEVDGVVTLAKSDADKAEDTVIIKTGDKIGLVVAGLKKAFDGYNGSSDFSEAVKAQGFYPSFCTAKEVLGDCVHVALHKSNSPAEAAEKISKTVEDFKSYVSALAGALPASAFYVDRYYTDLYKSEEGTAVETQKAASEADKVKDEADKAKADEAAKGEAKKSDELEAGKEPVKEEAKKADDLEAGKPTAEPSAEMAALKKSQDEIMNVLSELQKSVTSAVTGLKEEVKKELAEVNGKVEKAAELARKTDAALNGTVFAEPAADKPKRVEKNDNSGSSVIPLLDTAYDRSAVA